MRDVDGSEAAGEGGRKISLGEAILASPLNGWIEHDQLGVRQLSASESRWHAICKGNCRVSKIKDEL